MPDPATGMDRSGMEKCLAAARREPVHCAVAQGKEPAFALLLMDRNKSGRMLVAALAKAFPQSRNPAFGTVFIDVGQDHRLARFTLNKAPAGTAKRLARTLRAAGCTKVIILGEDGAILDSSVGEAEDGAHADTAPAADPAAALLRSLTALARQIANAAAGRADVTKQLVGMAEQAKAALRSGDLAAAATAIKALQAAIMAAGMGTPATGAADGALERVKNLGIAFAKRFDAAKAGRPAGAEQVKLHLAYVKAKKSFDGLVQAGDAREALAAAAAVEAALAALEAAGSPSAEARARTVAKAIVAVDRLDAGALKAMGAGEKAALAFDLCAAGQPEGGDTLKQLCKIYKNTGLDKPFANQRTQDRARIVAKVSTLPEVIALFDDAGEIDEAKWAALVRNEGKVGALLKTIGDAQAAMLGLPPLAVSTYRQEQDDTGAIDMGGCVWTESGLPEISLNVHPDAISAAKEAMTTILHETFHAHQDSLVKTLMAGELGPEDPIYPQILMFAVNKPGVGYLPPSVDFAAYEAQPVEVDAETQGKLAATDIFLAVRNAKRGV